ncbi:orotidine-5'-phosphate decarboxylase [Fodinibius halophilus]|uniref:Orotidine-5'-phosphate decarboxylase n=1 Tax=Fodinibius halophilus TaxID=1736908 RepID=A0A6M1T684_9BACT|nr:orotidine-5'-phosphate decarboxylase [Fodinibius halophilus]NGP89607.1 orotidine-5'-phosphate decarboxylase [Fodinibius halophilus]
MDFRTKLKKAVRSNNSTVCVGLDPNLQLLPAELTKIKDPAKRVDHFLKQVIDATRQHCAAYKPNLGFFEALGADGWDTFESVLDYIPDDKIIIADAKRGDISSTAEHYAKAFFETHDVDAVTLNPLMGFETLEPFLGNPAKSIYVLTLTSNPGAQDILLQQLDSGETLSTFIAKRLQKQQQDHPTAIGMVVGATKAKELEPVISHFTESPLLIPGVGKQGGSVSELSESLKEHTAVPLVNSSRSIIYAGNDSPDWKQAVAQSALDLKERLAPITARYVKG